MPPAELHRLPLPRSLRQQFMLAISALALLIAAGSLVAIYALNESAAAIRQLSEERLQHMQDAQDIVKHTLLIERSMQRILNSDSLDGITGNYGELNGQLDAIDRLAGNLGASRNDSAVLVLYQSGQFIRNAAHVLVRLKEDVLQGDEAFSRALRQHTASLLDVADPDMGLAVILFRLREANDPEKIAALHKQFVRKASQSHRVPQQVTWDMQTLQSGTADAGGRSENLFRQRMWLIKQHAALLRFHGELQRQAVGMVASAQDLSARYTDDYRGATKRVTETSGKNLRWVLTLLVANLVLAWVVSRYFLGRHVLNRLQQVSRYLRQGSSGSEHPDIPVRGSDEIGEMARAVEQFLKDRRKLAEADKELEEFSYSISHDLRVPLRAIDGFSHILLEEHAAELDEEGKRLLGVVRANTNRMGLLIDDMLQFFRAGRIEPRFTEIDMEKLAREVAEGLKLPAASTQLQWEIGTLPRVTGDAAMLRQVFLNLMSNAVKFSSKQPIPKIQVGAEVRGDEIVYYVKDNGVGFDMQYAGKLFGVFRRLHGVSEFEGSGIGLAIVKRIVTRHGGRVWAEGKVNGGATIYFALPIAPANSERETG